MNGYVEAGYSVVLGTLAVYAATLLRRERIARARLRPPRRDVPVPEPGAAREEQEQPAP